MTPDQFDKLRKILLEVARMAEAERVAYAKAACGKDAELSEQVLRLLNLGAEVHPVLEDGALSPWVQAALEDESSE